MSASEPSSIAWRKSSGSDGGSGCVEVAVVVHKIAGDKEGETALFLVRDSKDLDGPTLKFTSNAWAAFVADIKQSDRETPPDDTSWKAAP